MRRLAAGVALAALALPLGHAEARRLGDYCTDRPGVGTSPCTIDRGHLSFELGLLGWTLDRQTGDREDEVSAGDLLLRYGVSDDTEIQFGWTAYDHVRTRTGGLITRTSGSSDVTIAARHNFHNPDGSGFSAAVMPFATLPVGSDGIGAHEWGAGMIVPLSWELPHGFGIGATLSAEAAPDEDGEGRHFAYGGIVGAEIQLSRTISAGLEFSAARDRDPAGATTELIADVSLSWLARDDLQFDIGADFGLNRETPDFALGIGVAKRF